MPRPLLLLGPQGDTSRPPELPLAIPRVATVLQPWLLPTSPAALPPSSGCSPQVGLRARGDTHSTLAMLMSAAVGRICWPWSSGSQVVGTPCDTGQGKAEESRTAASGSAGQGLSP